MCRYHVDGRGRITFVDEGWRAFAAANAAPQFADTASLYGVPLLSFIGDSTTRQVYAVLMDRVRAEQVAVRVPFRCDAPALRRWMELELTPRPAGGVAFTSRELRTEPRDVVLAFDRPSAQGAELVRMCSWCKKVEAGAAWLPLELGVAQLGLFAGPDVPGVTHGICPECTRLFESGAGFRVDPV